MKSEEDRSLYPSRHQTGTRPTLPDSMDEVSGWASVDIFRENLGLNTGMRHAIVLFVQDSRAVTTSLPVLLTSYACMYHYKFTAKSISIVPFRFQNIGNGV